MNFLPTDGPTRYTGLETAFFDGVESLPWSKFVLILDQLKARIKREQERYCIEEVRLANELVRLADNLSLLFISQDTPLYRSQQTQAVTFLADDLIYKFQQPMQLNELPEMHRTAYQQLYSATRREIQQRQRNLQDHYTVESFLRSVDYSQRIEMSCLLGMSRKVGRVLDQLSQFNRIISERHSLMQTHVGANNTFKVNYILDHIPTLEEFYNKCFPPPSNAVVLRSEAMQLQ